MSLPHPDRLGDIPCAFIFSPWREDERWAIALTDHYPRTIQASLAHAYYWHHDTRFDANTWLRESVDIINSHPGAALIGAPLDHLNSLADTLADHYTRSPRKTGPYAFSATPRGSDEAQHLRVVSPSFWRRHLRVIARQATEIAAYLAGAVGGRSAQKYASKYAVAARTEQNRRNTNYLANTRITNGFKSLSLAEVARTPAHRAAEVYTIAKGLERLADRKGFSWVFATMTCPPHMHPNPSKGKSSWDGTTPKDAARFLSEGWARIRARIAKLDIDYHGIWTKEPHQDGCPHMHSLIYADAESLELIAGYIADEFGGEPATRFQWPNGSAAPTTYVTKYLLKAIGGTMTSAEIEDASEIETSAAIWGYRRFGLFGIQSAVGLWRMTRRIAHESTREEPIIGETPPHEGGEPKSFMLGLSTGDTEEAQNKALPPMRSVAQMTERATAGDFCGFIECWYDGAKTIKESYENAFGELCSRIVGLVDLLTGETWITTGEWVTDKANYPSGKDAQAPFKAAFDRTFERWRDGRHLEPCPF